MFANPEVSTFIDRLLGGQTPHGGAPPPTPGYRGALARGLLGDVTLPKIGGGFTAPAIRPGAGPRAPAPSEGVGRSGGSQVLGEASAGSSGGQTGASGLAAGIGKVGAGIESGLEAIAAKNQADAEKAALRPGGAPTFGGGVPGTLGTTGAPAATPVAADNLPSFARQPGISAGTPGAPSQDYLAKVAQIENPSGSPYATSSTGATGKFQFIPSTWRQFGAGGNIHDPAAQDAAMARFTQSNFNALQAGLGRPPTDGELYLAHQQGAAGALKLLQNPNTPAGQLVGSQAISVNGGNPSAPASAFVNKWGSRFGGAQTYGDQLQDQRQDAQPVTAGQSNPHLPGFDPSAVKFTNTPIGQQGADASAPVGVSSGASTTPPAGNAQSVIPGQNNPHMPGFDPSSVPFTNTPIGQQGMLSAPQVDPLALALAGGQMPAIDPGFGGLGNGLFG